MTASPSRLRRRPEVLAPAGDRLCMEAAVRAGADAVYFGLQGFNARARAENFDATGLTDTMAYLHEHAVRGYVALNTLVFDRELPALEAAVRACARAGVDAVIVQDIGVARLVRAVAPDLAIHASTQMTCTDAGSVRVAASLGASRVILARELSVEEIATIRAESPIDVEVFVHGALCIAYSGQCLTSEAIGGRSANRGACAQSCRLPYDVLVDGVVQDLGDKAYLLSPGDLEASAFVPKLVEIGVSSLKIEGRLKGPDYVAATTMLYRRAVDAAVDGGAAPDDDLRRTAMQMYTRGSGHGFLDGVDHQRLVDGRNCDHRGLHVGTCTAVRERSGRRMFGLRSEIELHRGDGLLVEGGREGAGEVGGRLWAIQRDGVEVASAPAGCDVELWLGPERSVATQSIGRAVWKTHDPTREKTILTTIERAPRRVGVSFEVRGRIGERAVFRAVTDDGRTATAEADAVTTEAHGASRLGDVLREKLSRLGETAYVLRDVRIDVANDAMIPPGTINRARRALIAELGERSATVHGSPTSSDTAESLLAAAARRASPSTSPLPGGLFVLCRNLEQARAAFEAGADGVYLDFLELTGTGDAFRALRSSGARWIGLAPPRIRKPGEEKIDRFLSALEPDALLVRGLGALGDAPAGGPARIGDFSLNVANQLALAEVMSRGVSAFTPSFDLDATQLLDLVGGAWGAWSEVVVHHPMPLFHMEHCVIAALLSTGRTHRDCGRPCEHRQVSLRDRAGMEHPVEADVGCRNTVFHAAAQSAAGLMAELGQRGVRRYRIELVREPADEVLRLVSLYRDLLAGSRDAVTVWQQLNATSGYGVVRGSLRVLNT